MTTVYVPIGQKDKALQEHHKRYVSKLVGDVVDTRRCCKAERQNLEGKKGSNHKKRKCGM